ncbi:uncharacterized protein EI90DRAFT_2911538 [Cantharellus anzutake]|uniref:uncharacterized protein n=1 Tax=Cantharellus anzutake TaxID=1750568 RepID=UPI0019083B39|nr:uncharacterized protein EI90DRAFT_2911538 [Cantharellus anzutake]KAF8336383.1 hypothetical protein EI90DRAFT_2911538 [Cantharellus anzutake]
MAYQGKTALITGGISGIGKNVAVALQEQGATVLLADINENASLLKGLNESRADSAFYYKVDVTDWDQQVGLFKFAIEKLKRVDYVFANAGIVETTFLAYTSPTQVEFTKPDLRTIDVNLVGALYTSNLAAQVFRTQEVVDGFRGKIILTGSVASFSAIPHMPLYTASKHAIAGVVRSLAPQLGAENITVNAVCPNVTRTALVPQEVFDIFESQGTITPNETVTNVFHTFLGESKVNGALKSMIARLHEDISLRARMLLSQAK